ncbi:MAG: hypothetical protein ACWA41_11005 [Putridiphycobacter sp.]
MVKLKAFTLIDTLVAVSITAIVIGCISFAYGYLVKSDHPFGYYKAKEQIEIMHEKMVESKNYLSKSIELENYTIVQEVAPYKGKQNLFLVTYKIKLNANEIYQNKRLVLNEEN